MDVVYEAKAAMFADLSHGSIFVGADRDGARFSAIKARIGQTDRFVTIGPFLPMDNGLPSAYQTGTLGALAFLDISEVCAFVPSSALEDVFGDRPERPGLVFLTPRGLFLGVRVPGQGDWSLGFMDLVTGEISDKRPAEPVVTIKSWSLVATKGNDRTELFRYSPAQEPR